MDTKEEYTKKIVLEEITEDQFNSYKPLWKAEEWKNGKAVLCEIKHTIVGTDYKNLLFFLLEHPYADELCVRIGNSRKWDKVYKRRIIDFKGNILQTDKIEEMVEEAKLAASETGGNNYLEIHFKGSLIGEKIDRASIEFSERNGLIIATKVVVPPDFANLFTINTTCEHIPGRGYHGILGIPDYEQLAARSIDSVCH